MGKKVVYMPSCHSTNDVAIDMVNNGNVEEGTIVITNHQTNGRGQQGNYWESDIGQNITCSLILKPKDLQVSDQFVLNVIISLGVADLVSRVVSLDAKVKWPNDIYCGGKKISGILINNTLKRNIIETTIVGIGLNVNQQSFLNQKASSLSLLSGNATYDLQQILESLISSIEKRYFQWKNKSTVIWEDYLSNLYWKGEVRTFKSRNEYFTGIVRNVTRTGRLIVELEECTSEYDLKEIEFVK